MSHLWILLFAVVKNARINIFVLLCLFSHLIISLEEEITNSKNVVKNFRYFSFVLLLVIRGAKLKRGFCLFRNTFLFL